MNSTQSKSPFYLACFGVILAIGLMASAFILGQQFKYFHQTGAITVKGVAEAEYKATVATWKIRISAWGNTYAEALKENQKNLNQLVSFLSEQGFVPEERSINPIDVDEHITYYTIGDSEKQYSKKDGFDATRTLVISTKDLAKVQQALAQIQNLKAENQQIYTYLPEYYLENLENIKRELISKATKDAAMRAEEFAKTSNVKVGTLKSASQGSFDISALNDTSDTKEYDGEYSTSTIDKKVRLVVTIQYGIN